MIPRTAPLVTIPYVCEHDLDLMLLEEFVASPKFLVWFAKNIGMPREVQLHAAACSVTTSTGESDLELMINIGPRSIAILIEDKLDAILQPQQAERYHKRGAAYIEGGKCGGCVTVIVGPRDYFDDAQDKRGFDRRVDLEDILEWFKSHPSLGNRRQYTTTLLKTAIERGCNGWKLVADKAVTDFWEHYWDLASSLAPELRMQEPSKKPSGSTFIYFRPHGLPANSQLVHKLNYGHVDLQFGGMGEKVVELEQSYGQLLEKGMHIGRAYKSGVIRIRVPEIDVARPFSESESVVREAIQEATRLLKWFRQLPNTPE